MIIRCIRIKRLFLLGLGIVVLIVIIGNSQPFQKLFYPLPYKNEVLKYSRQFDLDPLMVIAIMRVESRFDPNARSSKGAVGLMQLMPDTAQWAAEKMNIEYSHERLIEPEFNILIGCWYLSLLKSQYNGNLIAAVASYNGGRTPVNQWLDQKRWDGSLEDLDNIPFPETREYVKKVFNIYEKYSGIYKEEGEFSLGLQRTEGY